MACFPAPAGAEMQDVTPSFVTKNRIYRASCNGCEIRVVCTPAFTYLTILKPHSEAQYVELADGDVAKVLADFENIGDSAEKFQSFVNAAAARENRARAFSPAL